MIEKPRLSLLAFHHLLFEMSFVMNIIVMTIYWSTLHEERMQKPDVADPLARFAVYFSHSAPFIFSCLNFGITDVVISKRHGTIVLPFGIFYTYANYKETRMRGEYLYWFATWEDVPMTIAVFVGLYVFTASLWLSMAFVT